MLAQIPGMGLMAALLCVLASGCSSTTDLVELVPPTAFRSTAAVLAPMEVRLLNDRRPAVELGVRKYLGRSFVGGNSLLEPATVSFLRVLARDLQAARITERAALDLEDPPYVLWVGVDHLYGSFGEGLENLTLVLPTSGIEGRCEVRLLFKDAVGRVFLDRVFTRTEHGSAALLGGLEAAAMRALASAIHGVIEEALPVVRNAQEQFWKAYPDGAKTP